LNTTETVLVMEAGGKRNAFTSGVLVGLTRLGLQPACFTRVYACSSAAHTAAFFVTGQVECTPRIWIEELNGSDIFSFFNPLRGRRFGDVHRLVEHGCRELNVGALACAPELIVVLADLQTGEPLYVRCTPENIHTVLKGTCVVPRWADPIEFDGLRVVDGGIADPLPVQQAIADGARRLVVISNRPAGFRLNGIARTLLAPWAMFGGYRQSRLAFSQRLPKHYEATQQLLERESQHWRTFTIRPHGDLGNLFERNPKRVAELVETGQQTAAQVWPKLREFLA
jgi:predicted patatin/cPLA2 family phospholipase